MGLQAQNGTGNQAGVPGEPKQNRRPTMGTVITAAVLLAIVGLAVRKMIRDKRSGKSLQCGCDCAKCGGCGHKG